MRCLMVVTSMVSPSIVLQLNWSECVLGIPTTFWTLAPRQAAAQSLPGLGLLLMGNNPNLIPI